MLPRVGLVLTGGGARAAYQVGVLKGLSEIAGRPQASPFAVLCGTSAGALNAAALAARADHFAAGVDWLYEAWRSFHAVHIYRTDRWAVARAGLRWFGSLAQLYRRNPMALLDNTPLRQLLLRDMDFDRIRANLSQGQIEALAITVSGYTSSSSVTFYESARNLPGWHRPQRQGVPTRLKVEHLLASSAIPFRFPSIRIDGEYFGDGSMRQTAPISPALHLGANRVVVVGTGRQSASNNSARAAAAGGTSAASATSATSATSVANEGVPRYPSVAQIAGHALNSIFLHALEQDIEWLQRINGLVDSTPAEFRERMPFRAVEALVISPSQPIELLAARAAHELPASIKFLLKPLGGMNRGGANMTSYLLLEPGFVQSLVELGFNGTMARRGEVLAFLRPHAQT